MWVTWNYLHTDLKGPLTFEQKVEVFYQRALGWQLHIADLVANGGVAFGENGDPNGKTVSAIRHSGFAVLQICLSYFETIGRYTGATGGSRAAFRKGVEEVFPDLASQKAALVKAFVAALYEDARCGLYHNTQTARVCLGRMKSGAIGFDQKTKLVVVYPEQLPRVLKDHLKRFRDGLLNSKDASRRAVFERRFDKDSGTA